MNEIYGFMENNSDSQFSFDELRAAVTENPPNDKTITARLLNKFDDRIIFSTGVNRYQVKIVSFKDTGAKLLSNSWYEKHEKNSSDERMRIVKKAAEIIRQDIQTCVYDPNTYPPSDDFLKDASSVPETLKLFLEEVTLKKN